MTVDKIYLVGFMAAGKTTVARMLGARLGWRAEDIDELIEARERMTVADIFARHGEAYFRAAEREILRLLLPCATPSSPPAAARSWIPRTSRRSISTALSVWLDVPLATVIARLPADGRRPLAADRAQMERLFALRQAAYAQRAPAHRCRRGPRRRDRRAHARTARDWLTVRYLLLSDIHANIDAFDTVLDARGRALGPRHRARRSRRLRRGAQPVIDKVRALDPLSVIRGNHDKAACGLDDGSQFNQVARLAAAWTGQFLTPDNRHYLRELPMGPVQIDDLVEICHGAPFDEDYYIFDGNDALRGAREPRPGRCASSATRTCR